VRPRKRVERSDIQFRGKYILETALVDSYMTNAIANHFFLKGNPKRSDLMLILSNHDITFRTKEIIYRAILKKRYPDLWKEHSRDVKKLKDIAEYRNMLAHWGSIPPPFGADLSKVDYVTLYDIGKPEEPRQITKQSHNAKLKELLHLCGVTREIMNAIERRHPASKRLSKRRFKEMLKVYAEA